MARSLEVKMHYCRILLG